VYDSFNAATQRGEAATTFAFALHMNPHFFRCLLFPYGKTGCEISSSDFLNEFKAPESGTYFASLNVEIPAKGSLVASVALSRFDKGVLCG